MPSFTYLAHASCDCKNTLNFALLHSRKLKSKEAGYYLLNVWHSNKSCCTFTCSSFENCEMKTKASKCPTAFIWVSYIWKIVPCLYTLQFPGMERGKVKSLLKLNVYDMTLCSPISLLKPNLFVWSIPEMHNSHSLQISMAQFKRCLHGRSMHEICKKKVVVHNKLNWLLMIIL